MATIDDIRWFKTNFANRIAAAITGTPFDVDMLTAIACQESGELWGTMRHVAGLPLDTIIARCCGDTLDADRGRRAFPRTKSDLLATRDGSAMFDIARKALLDMAEHVPAYRFARHRPNKFCHGFGVFQYDLQFFLSNPRYFLERRYEVFENSLDRALGELKTGLRTLGLQGRSSITDLEFCHVAICYNTGGFNPSRGLKQGHESGGKFYGEFIRDYLATARTVATPGGVAIAPPPAGTASLPPAAPANATGPKFRVDITSTPLRLRSQPRISTPPDANVIATMPDGQVVQSFSGTPVNKFIEVEVTLGGQLFRGFASADFLVRVSDAQALAAAQEAALPPALARIPEAHLRPAAVSTKRTTIATARSLNEPKMPGRTASDPPGLRDQLGQIIAYLATDNIAHKRYQPRNGLTFCNIYAHDYCILAGAYLPRVWWSAAALVKLAAGQAVEPLLGTSVDEMRANDLYRWLRDFGQAFGWQRVTTLDDLQEHANLGGVALIVARRREEGRSGHIVAVVPETATETAKRDTTGHVQLALQSQAGSVNFRYGRSTSDWWKDAKFAEAAFWVHA